MAKPDKISTFEDYANLSVTWPAGPGGLKIAMATVTRRWIDPGIDDVPADVISSMGHSAIVFDGILIRRF